MGLPRSYRGAKSTTFFLSDPDSHRKKRAVVCPPFHMRVKIVLRDRETGRYFRDHHLWVTNPYDALTFRNILEAEEFCRAQSLPRLQVIQQSGYFPRPLRYMPQKAKTAALADGAVVNG